MRLADAGAVEHGGMWKKLTHRRTTLPLLLVEFEQGVVLQLLQLLEV
jgi:hypothetical protein